MQDDRELLAEIRDTLVQHAKVYAAWIDHQRQREADLDKAMATSIALQRAQSRFYRVTVLVGLPIFIIITLSVLSSYR